MRHQVVDILDAVDLLLLLLLRRGLRVLDEALLLLLEVNVGDARHIRQVLDRLHVVRCRTLAAGGAA